MGVVVRILLPGALEPRRRSWHFSPKAYCVPGLGWTLWTPRRAPVHRPRSHGPEPGAA